jgi:NAD(P) transhydrogenase
VADEYDLVVIGSGPAGEAAAELAATFGRTVAVVERSAPGGTVTTTGGAPTKTLREAALYLTGYRDRDVYQVSLETPPQVAIERIARRTEEVCALLQKVTVRSISDCGVEWIRGSGRLINGGVAVESDDGPRMLEAPAVVIATGSRPHHPAGINFDDPDICDSDEVLRMHRVPDRLLVVGAGPVGIEFATAFAALGVEVTVSDLVDRILTAMDGEIGAAMQSELERMGVGTRLGVGTDRVDRVGDHLIATLADGSTVAADVVLFAAGRDPNTAGLGLEEAGVETDPRGRIVVDDQFRTTVSGVYAVGDVLGATVASVAAEQGRVAAAHALRLDFIETVNPLRVSAVYGTPEVAGAGLTEEECRQRGVVYEVGRADLAELLRGAIAGRGGMLKLIVRRWDRRLVGVHCIGDIASEIVASGAMVLALRGTVELFTTLTLPTPTYASAFKVAAFDAMRRLMSGRWPGPG